MANIDYKTFFSAGNETWKTAIDRYRSFLNANMPDYFPQKNYPYTFAENTAYTFHYSNKIEETYLSDFTTQTQIKVPADLKYLLSVYGTFYIGNNLLKIFDEEENIFLTLGILLEKFGYTDILQDVGDGMLKSLNSFYYFFGLSFPQADETSFLYFNKAGNYGKISLSKDNKQMALRKTLPSMFNGSIDKYTLDNLISNQIDRIITNALTVRGYI